MILTVTLNPAVDFTVFGGPFGVHQTNRGRLGPPDPGGKGNNVARVAHMLGAGVTATGLIGGFLGSFIDQSLEREGIDTRFFRIDGDSRFTAAYIEEETGAETKIVPDGPRISPAESEGFMKQYAELIAGGRYRLIVVSGSLPTGLPEDFYGALIEAAGRFEIPVVLDSSGPPLRAAIARVPLMIKPNMTEAMELAGTRDVREVFRYLHGLSETIPVVALTMGGDGSVFFTGQRTARITCKGVPAKNQVGAGDAFVGGFSAAYSEEGGLSDRVFRWAAAAGTASARGTGLLFDRESFAEVLESLVVEDLEMY